ncbi:hypothetical protein DN592_27895 [Raoultella ornithinolytica]|nr:hypothetical protein DN592_27895 [Raoultella ornithinolytica]
MNWTRGPRRSGATQRQALLKGRRYSKAGATQRQALLKGRRYSKAGATQRQALLKGRRYAPGVGFAISNTHGLGTPARKAPPLVIRTDFEHLTISPPRL